MPIRLLGLNCSPRENSNSLAILERSFAEVEEKYPGEICREIVSLRDLKIQPCRSCDVCGKSKNNGSFLDCVLKDSDDVQAGALDKMLNADGIVVATPVYFGLPSDLFSTFIMRTRVLRHWDFALANRVVGVIAIAGRRSGGGETTIFATWLPFIRNGCLVVGNGDQTCQFGALGWAGRRGHILSDEWGMEQGVQVVERVYHVARLVQAGTHSLSYENPMRFSYHSGTRP